MNIYSYIISHDSGFAPNPFWGFLTLACCKPVIRRRAAVGDWVIGLTSKRLGNNIVFVMRISEKVLFAEYWIDKRFRSKRPNMKRDDHVYHYGDNIYKPISKTKYQQKFLRHSNNNGSENLRKKEHDLGGKYVLISNDFSYFGADPMKLPSQFKGLILMRGHKRFEYDETTSKNEQGTLPKLIRFLESLPKGIHSSPLSWSIITDKKHKTYKSCH